MQPNKLLKFIILVLLLSSLTVFSGCGGSVAPDNQPNEIIIEQTFESQSGIEFDTGVGLEVSVPPSLTENQMKLVVKYNSNPTQPQNDSSDFINLHSSYSISITPQEEPLGQKLFQERENRNKEPSNATLIFKIPQGVDSHNAVILEWTDEGWILAENEVGLPGGEVDGEDISIVPGHLSEFAIGEWLYDTVFSALKKIPEPPPPTPIIDIQEPILDDQNNLVMEVNLDSPYGITLNLPKIGSLGLAGMWYCIEVESDNDINVDINGGKYLPPGIKRDIIITFLPTGGDASICLQTGWCPLPRAALNWVSRLGLLSEAEAVEEINNIISLTEILLESYELYPNGAWNLEDVVWLIKKLLLQSFWKLTGSKIKYLANVVPVSIDIATFITASWFDGRPDLCVEVSPSLPIVSNVITVYWTNHNPSNSQNIEHLINVFWDPYPEASGYKVYRSVNGVGEAEPVYSGSGELLYDKNVVQWHDYTNIVVGNTYSYYVTACGDDWETAPSQETGTINTFLPPIYLVSPSDGETINNSTPTFEWSPVGANPGGGINFGTTELWVKDLSDDKVIWDISFNNITTSYAIYNGSSLILGHSYGWKVTSYGYVDDMQVAISQSEYWEFMYTEGE